ncbi:hypothetical protein AgCh_032281 [Apium graveolens]
MLRPAVPSKFPFIPVTDVAGEVVELGSDVKKFKTGDNVVAKLQDLGQGTDEIIDYKTREGEAVKSPRDKKYDVVVNCTPGQNLEYLVNQVKEGKLKIVIHSKYPFGKPEDAWAMSMSGHAVGKIIVEY